MSASTFNAAAHARSFAEILDDVASTSEETVAPSRTGHLSDASGHDWLFSLFGRQDAEAKKVDTRAFFDEDEADAGTYGAREQALKVPPSFDLDESKIAIELGLANAFSVTELRRARHEFARRNHPDLFAPNVQPLANARMQLANMLLDKRRKELEGKR